MKQSFDAIVVGLGAVGSAAACYLAQRGWDVLGLDRFAPPHAHGSSHGGSRIIRRAYFEGARYLPLLDRAYALWGALEDVSGDRLLHRTGGLMIGTEESTVVAGSRQSALIHGIPHEVLDARMVQAHFPAFRLSDDHIALWEPGAGLLYPERCIRAHLEEARRHGAALRTGEPVLRWSARGGGVEVRTAAALYSAGRLLLCAGGWLKTLLPELSLPLHIERQVNGWFRPAAHAARFRPTSCPVYIWEYAADHLLYGFPDLGEGVKAGLHHRGERVPHPDDLRRSVSCDDEEALRLPLSRLLPDAAGPLARAQTCFYTNTPDEDYLIDRHPGYPQVLFASACSGHGFKASSAVGEALADLAVEGRAALDLSPFRLRWVH